MVEMLSEVISTTCFSLKNLGCSIAHSSKRFHITFLVLLTRVVRDRRVNQDGLDFVSLGVLLIGPLKAILHVHIPAAIVKLGVL